MVRSQQTAAAVRMGRANFPANISGSPHSHWQAFYRFNSLLLVRLQTAVAVRMGRADFPAKIIWQRPSSQACPPRRPAHRTPGLQADGERNGLTSRPRNFWQPLHHRVRHHPPQPAVPSTGVYAIILWAFKKKLWRGFDVTSCLQNNSKNYM